MTLADSLGHLNFQLEGTDISHRALHTARHAVYPEESIKGIPEKTASKWFMRSRERNLRLVRVVPELRERAGFTLVNLTSPNASALKRFDVVFLRNVLIYFNREAQRRILSRVLSHLALRGWLFVGLSETAEGLDLPIERVAHSIYRRVA
jgi:chemotaxis protein methyltransferase CheR